MKLPAREPIEAYITEDRVICLKQESLVGEDPAMIILLPSDVPTVIGWLNELVAELADEVEP